jgi:HD-GYP domain-containing protein (c-di-GMP phosphodiesterase class II)
MGLQGDSIPLGARILAVCDAFDAMTTDRSYRLKMRRDEAINQLLANKGSQFDPQIVDAFVTMLEREQVKFPVNPHHSFQI